MNLSHAQPADLDNEKQGARVNLKNKLSIFYLFLLAWISACF
jgi:hypothetical protein